MIKIDGSYGEGGGQILRYAAALAAATGEKIEIYNIRAKRPNPGLRPQHATSLKIMRELFGGYIEGLEIGSRRVLIDFKGPKSGNVEYDIGTAGSISLVIQSIIPALILADSPSQLTLIGGTDVKWSPTIDYMTYVYENIVSLFGAILKIHVIRRGYYPKGGGKVRIEVEPTSRLKSISLGFRDDVRSILIKSVVSLLPSHILYREVNYALDVLKRHLKYIDEKLTVDKYLLGHNEAAGPGTSILIVANHTNNLYSGGDAVGEKGRPAEKVGEDAALKFIRWYSSKSTFDANAGDMVIPFMALTSSKNIYTVPEVTSHIKSALYVVEKILNLTYNIEKLDEGRCYRIIVS